MRPQFKFYFEVENVCAGEQRRPRSIRLGRSSLSSTHMTFLLTYKGLDDLIRKKITERSGGQSIVRHAFNVLGAPRDGISVATLRRVLGRWGVVMSDGELSRFFDRFPQNADGKVDFQAFITRIMPHDALVVSSKPWYVVKEEREEAETRAKRRLRSAGSAPALLAAGDGRRAAASWSSDELLTVVRRKILERGSSGSHALRNAHQLLGRPKKGRLTADMFATSVRRMDIFAADAVVADLFKRLAARAGGLEAPSGPVKDFRAFVQALLHGDAVADAASSASCTSLLGLAQSSACSSSSMMRRSRGSSGAPCAARKVAAHWMKGSLEEVA